MKRLWPVKKKTVPDKKRFSAPYRYGNTCKGLKRLSNFIVGLFGKKSKTEADKAQFAVLMAELAELRNAITNLIGEYERVVSERDALKKELAGYKTTEKGGTYEKGDEKVSGASVPERL